MSKQTSLSTVHQLFIENRFWILKTELIIYVHYIQFCFAFKQTYVKQKSYPSFFNDYYSIYKNLILTANLLLILLLILFFTLFQIHILKSRNSRFFVKSLISLSDLTIAVIDSVQYFLDYLERLNSSMLIDFLLYYMSSNNFQKTLEPLMMLF